EPVVLERRHPAERMACEVRGLLGFADAHGDEPVRSRLLLERHHHAAHERAAGHAVNLDLAHRTTPRVLDHPTVLAKFSSSPSQPPGESMELRTASALSP